MRAHNNHKSQQQRKKLLKTIFDHVNGLPYYDVKNSVILVSYTEDHSFAFQKITGKERISSDKMPYLHKFKDGTSLIDPTTAFLQPETNFNFITMHYLMNIAEQVKFVFVFNSADTIEMPLVNITKVLTKFICMFKHFETKKEVAALTASCGIFINGCKAAQDITMYSERIGGEDYNQKLLEPTYIQGKQGETIRQLVRGILERKQIVLCPAGNSKPFLEEFTDFVAKLSPYELAGKVELRLISVYKDFVQCNIYKLWEQTFKKIYSDLQEIVVGGKGHILQQTMEKVIGQYDRRNSKDKIEVKESSRAVRLLQVINALMQIIMKLVKNQIVNSLDPNSNQQVLAQFLDTLYNSGFLKVQFIRRFLMSYFLIRKFLSKTGDELDDPENDLFHRISFCDILGNIDAFNLKMRALTLALLAQLEEDLAMEGKQFPWEETLGLLNSLLSLREQPQFAFFTDRITKKLLKCRAELAFRLIGRSQRNQKEMLRAELKFVRYSCESRLVPDRVKTDVLKSIALKLSEHGRNDLSLQILTALPQYEVHQNIRYLYEKELQLNAEIWQYLPLSRRHEIIDKHFEGYQHFMLTVGFVETFRELCMECLRLADTQEDRRRFKDALLRAKGDSRDLHSRFLQERIIDEKQVVIGEDFLNRLQRQITREGLI